MATIQEKRASHEKLMRDIAPLTQKMEKGELTEAEGKDLDSKAAEALQLQTELEQHERLVKMQEKGRDLGRIPLPGAREEKADENPAEVVGYATVGEQFVRSAAFKQYVDAGMPITDARIFASRDIKGTMVPVTREQKAAWAEMDRKSLPTFSAATTGLGASIEPTRLPGINLSAQDDALRLLSVINQGATNSNSVEYLRLTFTRAADAVADSGTKPEAGAAYTVESATVRTQAVTIPVTEQMLADAPALITAINGRLMYDLEKLLEEEMMYGSGSGQHFAGILNDSDVLAAPSSGTVLDQIRRGMARVRKSGFSPNAVVVDPIDAAEIVLTKGSDNHYLYQVFPAADGSTRVWGLQIVESSSMEETAIASEPERNILVGDFTRGATLWNREGISLAVGYVNDQFVKNQRTIRAERRAAFAVTEPLAFRKILTHTASGAS